MTEKVSFDTLLFWMIGGASAKKSGQRSENMDTGCLEYQQKYFGVDRSHVCRYCFPQDKFYESGQLLSVSLASVGGRVEGGADIISSVTDHPPSVCTVSIMQIQQVRIPGQFVFVNGSCGVGG